MRKALLKSVLEKTQEPIKHGLDWLLDILKNGAPLTEDAEIVAAMTLMNRRLATKHTTIKGMDRTSILRGLDVFRIPQEEGIAEYASDAEFNDIVLFVAQAIIDQANDLKPDELHKLGWCEVQEPIVVEAQARHPKLFEKVLFDIKQANLGTHIRQLINNWERRSQRFSSARIQTQEEYQSLTDAIEKGHADIVNQIETSDGKEELKAVLLEEARLMFSSNLAFASLKFSEEPTRVLYKSSGRGVTVKVKLPKSRYTYHKGHKGDVKVNQGIDATQYPLIVSLGYLDDFLAANNVRSEDIWVDPESIDQFYMHGTAASVRLTPKFIANWFGIDCPVLKRCVINKHYGQTLIGMTPPHFENNLVEMSWSATYVDNDVTEEEMQAFADYREDSTVTKQMRNIIQGRQLLKDGKYDGILEAVTLYDQAVQEVINANKQEVQDRLFEAFPNRIKVKTDEDGSVTKQVDDDFGLDCGFVNIFTNDPEYKQNRNLLKAMKDCHFFWMGVSLPIFSQSITFNRVQFSIVKDIVMREKQVDLYANFILD